MPPHTTLHYTMPPNTTNSKSTATTANNGTTQMNTNNKSVPTPTKTSRQRSATSGSSYVFAPSWLANLNNNKSGPSPTVLNSAYVSTSEEKSVKEVLKGVGASKKEGFGINRQIKEGFGKDGNSSLNRSSINGITSHSSSRSRSRDLSGSRLSGFGETENHELSNKAHGRSRSVSQVNHSSSNFDRNFPILAKKNLSVDLPAKNIENIWANSDKSKLLSPTTTPSAEEHTKFNIPNTDNEPELERRMSLVPKAGISKLDGKRANRAVKCKVTRSMSLDSGARGPNGNSDFGFGVGTGILNNRSLGQTQNSRSYIRDTATVKPTSIQSQRPRAASISSPNGIKKLSVTSPRVGGFGHSTTISGRRSSINNNSKYLWSNNTMGKMGYFKILPDEEEEDEEEEEEGFLNDRKGDVNYLPNIDESVENVNNHQKDVSVKDEVIDNQNPIDSHHSIDSQKIVTSSIESEEKFLLQLGWQKPRNKDNDNNDWAITDEEKRFFINLIRALNGISISDDSANNELSFNEINHAKKKWATLVKNMIINGGDKIFNTGYQSSVTKHVTFSDED